MLNDFIYRLTLIAFNTYFLLLALILQATGLTLLYHKHKFFFIIVSFKYCTAAASWMAASDLES